MKCACAILSSVACPALQYFSTLSHKLWDLKKKLNIKYVLSYTFLILGTERDMIKKNVFDLHV